jgi:hypothetical protein
MLVTDRRRTNRIANNWSSVSGLFKDYVNIGRVRNVCIVAKVRVISFETVDAVCARVKCTFDGVPYNTRIIHPTVSLCFIRKSMPFFFRWGIVTAELTVGSMHFVMFSKTLSEELI